MRKIRKLSIVLIILGLLFLCAAVVLCSYNEWDSERAAEAADEILRKLESSDIDDISILDDSGTNNISNIEDLDINNILTPTRSGDMFDVTIDGNEYIGILEIPSLGLKLPVMNEWNYEKLQVSPCRYTGSYRTDDLVICAHNYYSHFGRLSNADIGEDVYFTDIHNMTIHYIISNRETIIPTAVEEMIDGSKDWDLTLFTCYWDGRTRCTVRCVRVLEDE